MIVSTQTLRSNDSITVLPEVVHNVRLLHLQLSILLHMASCIPRVLFWWGLTDILQHRLYIYSIAMLPA